MPTATVRREAVKLLGESDNPQAKQILVPLLQQNPDGSFAESDAGVRAEAKKAIQAIEQRFIIPQILGMLFSGLSLGSVLLLAALGLAITFGLMGIINMAHGEMLMLGAYTTYVVQTFFRNYLPDSVDWYLVAAVPMAFLVVGGGRRRARTQRDPFSLRSPPGDLAHDLGHQPDPDSVCPHVVRRPKRRSRQSGVDVGRFQSRRRRGVAVQPHRHHPFCCLRGVSWFGCSYHARGSGFTSAR